MGPTLLAITIGSRGCIATAILLLMDVEFRPSAFNHGYDDHDFFEVLASRPIKRRSQRGMTNVYELFGRNLEGSYLHVVYRRAEERTIVFHMHTMTDSQRRYYRKHIR